MPDLTNEELIRECYPRAVRLRALDPPGPREVFLYGRSRDGEFRRIVYTFERDRVVGRCRDAEVVLPA